MAGTLKVVCAVDVIVERCEKTLHVGNPSYPNDKVPAMSVANKVEHLNIDNIHTPHHVLEKLT